ncbi:hypothetical protein D3C84_1252360 [compost metagenome]
MASSELPPKSKKLRCTPMASIFNTACQTAAMSCCSGVAGACSGASVSRSGGGAMAASAALSILPLLVSGSAGNGTIRAGTM